MTITSLSEIYDRFAESYDDNRDTFDIDHIVAGFKQKLDRESGKLLDLGCGAGGPMARTFVDCGWEVTGVDFSRKMLELANKNIPQMQTVLSDICKAEFDNGQFDAITAIYSLFHIPREKHGQLFASMHDWLKDGGMLLFTYATEDYTGAGEFDGYIEFMEERLFYSHDKPEHLYDLLNNTGFTIQARDKHCVAGETFLWVSAQKIPKSQRPNTPLKQTPEL